MRYILLTIILWKIAGAITDLMFGKRDEVKYKPIPPKSGQPMFTTDMIITENTEWLTEKEWLGL